MRKTTLIAFTVLLTTSLLAAEDGWLKLFNGKDLTGWIQRGGKAKYEVKDGIIVGSTVPNTDNSFLCTEKDYADFILELEFKVDPKLNSGVQVRSECFDKPTTVKAGGKDIKIPAGRVHGYQVEIDMDPVRKRWWTGGIYDEARRGWLYPGDQGGSNEAFTADGAKLSKPGEWNRFRIEAAGDSIKTFLNGEPRAEIKDDMTRRGLIALQVHSIGKDEKKAGITVQFRNIRLKPMP
jgi:hypothetical protein